MKVAHRRRLLALVSLGIVAVTLGVLHEAYRLTLRDPRVPTGYLLLALVVLLAAYGVRKRLPFLPLGRSATWLRLHVWCGLLALFVFALHVGTWQLTGTFEQALGVLFLVVSASGIGGYLLSRWIPPRLTRLEHHEEMIFERIPRAMLELRGRVEKLVLDATEECQSAAIAEFYERRLVSYFSRPRNRLHHLLGTRAHARRMRVELDEFRSCLDEAEREHFAGIERAIQQKEDLDSQFAGQGALKAWLFLHIPATACLLLLVLVHVILVYAYGAA